MPEETLDPDAIADRDSARALPDRQTARLIAAPAPLDPEHPADPEDEDRDG
jgi:hypothetical protein